jgi:hypothetical protein
VPELQRDTRRSLATALLALPNVDNPAVRAQLMLDWPPTLRGNVPLSNIPSIDLNSMIVAAAQWATPDGSKPPLVLLIENAQDLVRGSAAEGQLGQLLVAVQQELTLTPSVPTPPDPASLLVPPAERAASFTGLVAAFRAGDYEQVVELSHGLPSDYPGLAPLVQRAESGIQAMKIIADKIAAAWADQKWDEVLRLAKEKPPPPPSVQPLIADAEQALAPPPTPVPGPPPSIPLTGGPSMPSGRGTLNRDLIMPESFDTAALEGAGRPQDRLVAALAAIPAYAERRNRDLLLLDLSPDVAGTIPRADDPAQDLWSIVTTLVEWGTLAGGTPAVATLIENAQTLTPDAGLAAQFQDWLADLTAHPPPSLNPPARFHALASAYARQDWAAVRAWTATLPADYPGLQPLLARMQTALDKGSG